MNGMVWQLNGLVMLLLAVLVAVTDGVARDIVVVGWFACLAVVVGIGVWHLIDWWCERRERAAERSDRVHPVIPDYYVQGLRDWGCSRELLDAIDEYNAAQRRRYTALMLRDLDKP